MFVPRPSSLMALLFSVATAGPAWSRLGESRGDCIKRYGPPVAEVPALLQSATGAAFLKGEIRIRIEFVDDKAAFLSFSRRGLRQEDRQTLLELNAGPLLWNPPGEFLGRLCWTAPATSRDTSRHASAYQAAGIGYLDMATDAWAKAMRAQQAVQFAIQPRPVAPAPAIPGSAAPAAPVATGKLEGF